MKLTCHSCGAKYTVSDEKIQGKTVKMKCRKCGSTIVVGGTQADAGAAAGADDAGSPPAGSFLVNVADGDQRTMTLGEIADAYRAGVVTDDTYVWADGMTDWQAIAEHAEVAAAVRGSAPAQPSMHSVPAPDPAATPSSPGYGVADGAAPAYAAEAPRVAAAKKEGKASRDLFGQDRPSTGGGLFGGSSASTGSGGSLVSSSSSSGTGKRDENSVLFSLSALTSVETSAPAGKTTAKKDDSGLIDLKALAASAPSTPTASSPTEGLGLLPETPGVFPLGLPVAPPPQAAPAMSVDAAPPPAKSKLPLVIGGAGALAAMVAVFFLVKGDPPPPPAPTPTPVTAAAPAPTPEPVPTPAEPAPEPSATASASASAPVAARPTGKWPPPKPGGAAAKPPSGGAAAPAAPPKPPPPPKSKCGCAPNDLMCNMKCSAGKK